jgi:hypothetical protein
VRPGSEIAKNSIIEMYLSFELEYPWAARRFRAPYVGSVHIPEMWTMAI